MNVRRSRTAIATVSKVDDQTETLKGYSFEKAIGPDLELKIIDT